MAKRARPAPVLNDQIRTFIVQQLAMFDTPQVVADAVKKEFGVDVTRQSIEGYDPTKKAGAKVSAKWHALFDETRKVFLEDTSKIAISHRAVRIRALQRMAEQAETMRNYALAAQLLEQAAKEMGGLYTNRREHSGSITIAKNIDELTDEELTAIAAGGGSAASDPA
jgi:hypothetical protein